MLLLYIIALCCILLYTYYVVTRGLCTTRGLFLIIYILCYYYFMDASQVRGLFVIIYISCYYYTLLCYVVYYHIHIMLLCYVIIILWTALGCFCTHLRSNLACQMVMLGKSDGEKLLAELNAYPESTVTFSFIVPVTTQVLSFATLSLSLSLSLSP